MLKDFLGKLARHNLGRYVIYRCPSSTWLLRSEKTSVMAIRVVEFSNGGYKIRREIVEFWVNGVIGVVSKSAKI